MWTRPGTQFNSLLADSLRCGCQTKLVQLAANRILEQALDLDRAEKVVVIAVRARGILNLRL